MWDQAQQREAELKFFEALYQHKKFVYEAGLMIGDIPVSTLFNHDASKFLRIEYEGYARNFHGDKGDPAGFARAWLHHIHNNPHHWQYWMFPTTDQLTAAVSPSTDQGFSGKILPMPELCVREMVADWMGASMAYTGSWGMTDWLKENLPKIEPNLHPETVDRLAETLYHTGYGEIVHNMNWPAR